MSAKPLAQRSFPDIPVIVVPYAGDPYDRLADILHERHAARLPDLSRVAVLLPSLESAPRLRRLLLERLTDGGRGALLGPEITTLRGWIGRRAPPRRRLLNDQGRELMLVEALREHPGLLGAGNAWTLAESLAELFDELTRHQVAVDGDAAAFARRLSHAYGAPDQAAAALTREAQLVHTLWRAWRAQQEAEDCIDAQSAYIEALAAEAAAPPAGAELYAVGCTTLFPAEAAWLAPLAAAGRATLIAHAGRRAGAADEDHPDVPVQRLLGALGAVPHGAAPSAADAYTEFLDAVYVPYPRGAAHHGTLCERARACAARHARSPAVARLAVFTGRDAEEEAAAIDLQIRRWLIDGRRRIGIIAEDRRLARRVRALLERAGLALRDTVGWALSTTRAAAVLERWLQCCEEDFEYQALLDLLKSPFLLPDRDPEELRRAAYRLEHDIILHENIPRGVARYRQHIRYRAARLGWPDASRDGLLALLDRLEAAAAPLLPLARGARAAPADFLAALEQSLRQTGLWQGFTDDAAGAMLLEEFGEMRAALHGRGLRITWLEFRGWLGRALERATFRPPAQGAQIQLLTLLQSSLQRFDALIIAGADGAHLPGRADGSPYFNDQVRGELGLPRGVDTRMLRFHHYRRLLESAPRVLITLHEATDGSAAPPSPWLLLLQAFHRSAYGAELADDGLAALVRHPGAQIRHVDRAPLPARTLRPRPALPAALLPRDYSATCYQRLVDCPYRFFAADGLGLAAPEPVREALEKSDYGERVHDVLEAFHGGSAGAPPFPQPLTEASRAAAQARLEELSRAAFAADLEDNVVHRGWLQRWLRIIPAYIEWQIERAREWRVAEVELRARQPGPDGTFALSGRLDRVDRAARGNAIVDYKTGTIPKTDEVLAGEAVQLPFYALLAPAPARRAEYLRLDDDAAKSEAVVEGAELARLGERTGRRLSGLVHAIRQGAALPAWGDEATCARCDMGGVCRRQVWARNGAAP